VAVAVSPSTAAELSSAAHTQPARRIIAATRLVLCLAVGVTGCASDPRPEPHPDRPPAAAPAEEASSAPPSPLRKIANPVTVAMPRLGIDARLQPLGLDAAGVLTPPAYGQAGWYAAGPEPGEPGPAVIAGHVDSEVGPDVFAPLSQARPGHRILIDLANGTALVFRVTEVERFAQADFPTRRVYGATDEPELRLITCGGDYDHTVGRYQDNVVVFAELAN
jgi:hypothetical protein